MRAGDLVKCTGACYSRPVNHQGPSQAIRYYDCLLPDGTLGVIVDMIPGPGERVWCQVLTGGRTVWLTGSGVRSA